jgi:hypothetical protein
MDDDVEAVAVVPGLDVPLEGLRGVAPAGGVPRWGRAARCLTAPGWRGAVRPAEAPCGAMAGGVRPASAAG